MTDIQGRIESTQGRIESTHECSTKYGSHSGCSSLDPSSIRSCVKYVQMRYISNIRMAKTPSEATKSCPSLNADRNWTITPIEMAVKHITLLMVFEQM